MLEAPALLAGAAAGALLGIGLTRPWEDATGAEADESAARGLLEDRINAARSSTALTYRESDEPRMPNMSGEALERRANVLSRAQGMLDGARQTVQEALDEAVFNKDYEAAEEYVELLEKMRPLPQGIVPTSVEADYKRWVDPEALK